MNYFTPGPVEKESFLSVISIQIPADTLCYRRFKRMDVLLSVSTFSFQLHISVKLCALVSIPARPRGMPEHDLIEVAGLSWCDVVTL
jgi:hypothetical protein